MILERRREGDDELSSNSHAHFAIGLAFERLLAN